ncbi:hypothetical protein AB0D10_39420 [Kitasatospora sp. NPDC048545]|uniref:hypothetical protein n=1 Tax=Kitasatospora sp. NPDC048545 TaxID=3157208 RepID=UPI0033EBA8D7
MRSASVLRSAAIPAAAALALLLTACGPDNSDNPAGAASTGAAPTTTVSPGTASPSTAATALPTITAAAPTATPTAPSRFADALPPAGTANGTFTDSQKGDISLSIGPTSVVKGDIADLADFLKPEDMAGKTPYYVRVTYTHTGGNGIYEPYFNLRLRAMVSDTAQARKVDLLSAFPKCESDVPHGGKDFVKGQSDHECAIYLAPADKPLQYLVWLDKDNKPLAWKTS